MSQVRVVTVSLGLVLCIATNVNGQGPASGGQPQNGLGRGSQGQNTQQPGSAGQQQGRPMTSIGERNRGPAIGQQNAGQQNAGQPFTVPNSNGRQQGLPGLSNSTNRNIGQGNSGNQRQDNETYRREFSNNALRFDTNSDGQLAANELTNLFLVLASSLQLQQTNYYNNLYQRQNNQASAPSTTTTSVTHSTSGYGQPFANVNQRFAQRQDMRQAAFLFLQMAMQFDSNGDGLLSQAELLQLAGALIANDMNLLIAAGGIFGL